MRRLAGPGPVIVAVTALLLTGCSGAADPPPSAEAAKETVQSPSVTSPRPRTSGPLARFYNQQPKWRDCHRDFQCARVAVPINYAEPDGRTIRLAVLRLPAGDQPKGSLVVNPGGPGASGVTYALNAERAVSDDVRERYDVVGFDPRGVGRSAGLDCVSDRELDRLLAIDGSPDTPSEERATAEAWSALGAGCLEDRPELTAHVSTQDAARDLDVLRAVLGDRKLTYLGKSYGTYLGATYAELFPKRVDRLVLDGMLDPAASGAEVAAGQAEGFQRALRAFLDYCVPRESCPLDGNADDAQRQLGALLDRIDRQPIDGFGGRQVTESLAVLGIAVAMYDQSSWPLLEEALDGALGGDGAMLLTLADYYSDRGPGGKYSTNAMEAIYAVNCLDRPEASELSAYRSAARRLDRLSPVFGRFIAWGSLGCRDWPVPPVSEPHAITAKGAKPILVVGTTRDPATPYRWAVSAAKQFESGRLLTYVGDGHTAYRRGSDCIDDAVDAYLLRGSLPAEGTRCR